MSTLKEKIKELDSLLVEKLSVYEVKRKSRLIFYRKVGDCIQHICFVETKIRGVDQIHIAVTVGFTYVELNKLIYFIQNEEYKVRATSINDMSALVENNEIYRFYISGDTNLIPIVNAIIRDIKKYALDYLDSCNTMEKYRKELIERNEKVRLGIYGLKRPEWNLLALELLLNYDGYKKILEEYETDFKSNHPFFLPSEEYIKNIDINKKEFLK